jgi:hypothetical protein
VSVLDLEFKKKQEIQIRIKNLEGAQIRHCIDNWRKLTSDPEILDIVTALDSIVLLRDCLVVLLLFLYLKFLPL